MLSKGVSKIHAKGILANIEAESNFNPSIEEQDPQGGDGGIGLFQHTGPRRISLSNYVKNNFGNWKKQIDFALQEPGTSSYLNTSFKNPEDASEWFTLNWEVPKNAQAQAAKRKANVSKYNF